MKINAIAVCAVGFLAVAGCDRLDEVVNQGRKVQEETRRAQELQRQQTEERQASLRAERDTLNALIRGKMAVLSNRVTEAEAAIRTLQADRSAFSREMNGASRGAEDVNGAGLERVLASPAVGELAMKYLHMDFSVARGEYAEAIAKARADEAEYKKAIRDLNRTFEALLDANPQVAPAARRNKAIATLKREHEQLERKRTRLAHVTIPTGNVYSNRRDEHDREMRKVDTRLSDIERMIDQLRSGDASERKDADLYARNMRERALGERNRAVDNLKREYEKKDGVLKTVRIYTDKTLRRLEQAFVKEAADLDERLRKSREGCLTLQGIRESVPGLSADGLKRLHGQVQAL